VLQAFGSISAPLPPGPRPADAPNPSQGYQGFGSFHTEDVEQLMRRPAVAIESVVMPAAVAHALSAALVALRTMEFGRAARRHFLVDFDQCTFLNHGEGRFE
jgi:hypothetical protein